MNAFNLIVKLTAAFELKLIEKEERKSNYETKYMQVTIKWVYWKQGNRGIETGPEDGYDRLLLSFFIFWEDEREGEEETLFEHKFLKFLNFTSLPMPLFEITGFWGVWPFGSILSKCTFLNLGQRWPLTLCFFFFQNFTEIKPSSGRHLNRAELASNREQRPKKKKTKKQKQKQMWV